MVPPSTFLRLIPSRHSPLLSLRRFSSQKPTGTRPSFPQDAQKPDPHDRNHMDTSSSEYSKSGSDDAVSHESEASYGGDTSPETQKEKAGKGNIVNPLEVSPAKREIRKQRNGNEVESGAEKTGDTGKRSPKKGKGLEYIYDKDKNKGGQGEMQGIGRPGI